MTIRLLKLKRRLSASPPPDLLLLDGPVDAKRSRTDLDGPTNGNNAVAVFQRLCSAPASHSLQGCPEGRLKPNITSALSSLTFTKEDVSDTSDSDAETKVLVNAEEEKEKEMEDGGVVFDVYILKENVDLVTVDLATIDRVYIPEEELLLHDTSDYDDSDYSDDDSNAESYYQNDYPDEEDDHEYAYYYGYDEDEEYYDLEGSDYYEYRGKDEDFPYHKLANGSYFGEEDDDDDDNQVYRLKF